MLDPDMPTQELRLHMGELTLDEVRVARAAIRWANSAINEGGYMVPPEVHNLDGGPSAIKAMTKKS